MDSNEFDRRTVNALNNHARELDAMESGIMAAARSGNAIPSIKEIFKEISEVAEEA